MVAAAVVAVAAFVEIVAVASADKALVDHSLAVDSRMVPFVVVVVARIPEAVGHTSVVVGKIVVGSMGMVAVGIAALVVVVGQQVVVPLWQLVAVVLLGG